MRGVWCLLLGVLAAGLPLLVGSAAPESHGADDVDFPREIEPILRRCTRCHSGHQTKGGFSLDTRERFLAGGLSGPAVSLSAPKDSLLVELIRTSDPEERMPQDGEPLTETEIQTLERWLAVGAPWPEGFTFTRWRRAPIAPRSVSLPAGDGHPIDLLLEARAERLGVESPTGLVDDRLFARRVWLDTVGLLPPPDELESFVRSAEPDKRVELIDRLLADRVGYAEHWLSFFSDLLRNDDRGPGYIDGGRRSITAWLYRSLHDNVPLDRLVTELIDPVPGSEGLIAGIRWRGVVNESQRPAMQAAQNVAQVFLGTNLKCASCHDSFVNYWKLSDAYGFAAAFSETPLELHRCDRPTGELATPSFLFGELGVLTPGVDRATRLEEIARLVVTPENGRFARTWVNRIWDKLLGRGLVTPIDDLDQLPLDQDLLDWLADDFVTSGYDQRALLKRIFTSHAYQRPSVAEETTAGQGSPAFRGPLVRHLSAEQFVDAISELTRTEPGKIVAALPALEESPDLAGLQWIWRPVPDPARVGRETVEFTRTFELESAPSSARVVATCDNEFTLEINGARVLASQEWTKPVEANVTRWVRAGANTLRVEGTNSAPSPAGLALVLLLEHGDDSSMIVTDASWRATLVTEDRSATSEPVQRVDDAHGWNLGGEFARLVRRRSRPVRASLVANDRLLTALGRPNREQVVTRRDQAATTLQALELVNGDLLYQRLVTGSEYWLARHGAQPAVIVEDLFRRALGRPPGDEERAIALEVVGPEPSRDAVADLLWVLIVHPEFLLIQ